MRLVIDMQGAQSASRFRGIGRYTLSLVQEMAQQRGEHEILLTLNAAYADTIEPMRAAFADLLPSDAIKVYEVPSPVGGHDTANNARRKVTERMVEAFFASLQPDVIFIPSLFEEFGGEAVTSVHSLSNAIPTAVVIYDLIPLIYRQIYLASNPSMERWYFSKLNHLKRADLLLSISESSGREARDCLNFPEHTVANISAACSAQFFPIVLSEAQQAHLKNAYGISRPFVMNTGGTDQRKNLDGLFRAFASLPAEMRKAHALVLVGREVAEQKSNFVDLAKRAGLRESELIFTGYVSDAELNLLYNACTLFVFPSWHEGFGLPVLEAMACGKAVIAANSSSLPEVVGRQDALFAPRDDDAMASKMAEVLQNPAFRQELERHGLEQAQKFSWSISASRAWAALSHLQAEHSAQRGSVLPPVGHRPKLAFVSPLPPEKTGIADYSAELLPELSRHYDITVIVQQESVNDAWVKANATIQDAAWLRQHAHEFERVVYQFGNSPFHSHMFDLLAEIPGVVVLHDFYLSWPVWHRNEHGQDPQGWTRALLAGHGWSAVRKRMKVTNWPETVEVVTAYPCNLSVLQQALGVVVHSDFSRQMAEQYYGLQAAERWSVIPLLRQSTQELKKTTARENLPLPESAFLVCSFGQLDPTKFNHRLLEAWLASPLSKYENCYLVFVGENHGGDYGHDLTNKIAQSSAKGRVLITGWVSDETYRGWLVAADIGVQLRSLSRGETSAAVLDCMNYGLPTIVNAHGSMAELPADAVWLLPDAFSDAQLIEAITSLWQDAARRSELGTRARARILSHHNPRRCADQYAEAIEATYAQAENSLFGLMQALPQLTPPLPVNEYPRLSEVLSVNFPPQPRLRQLMLDISELAQHDLKSGIERVTRALLEQILLNPPAGWSVQPVYATTDRSGYRYARQFTSHFLNIPGDWAEDVPVQAWEGDVFFGLDFHPHIIPLQESTFIAWRNRGVAVYFLVHDLLPVLMPEVFPEGAREGHYRWLQTIGRFDGIICVSRAVADEMYDWLQTFGEKRLRPFALHWSHSGADIANSTPSSGLPEDASITLSEMQARPTFLMVGTIEPRKGILQTLQAFDLLWQQGYDINLVIVGKEGWKNLPDSNRRDIPQTVQALRSNDELGKRLFWLEGISDEYLELVYTASTCLIAASYGEGFGLPLIEAARHGLPIVARDIPVFREVTAGQALFFNDTRNPEVIAEAIHEWLALNAKDQHPRSDAMPHLTWVESASNALDILLDNTTPYRIWLPDGVRRYWGADPCLHTQVGEAKGRSMNTTGKAGFLIYGPYERFEPGRYRVILKCNAAKWTGGEYIDISIDDGLTQVFHRELIEPRQGAWNEMFSFNLEENKKIEIRIWVAAETILCANSIEFEILSGDYDNKFAVMCKSYYKDLEWVILLYRSWLKYSIRKSPFYLVVPRNDVFLFQQRIDNIPSSEKNDIIILSEEDVLDVTQIEIPKHFDGWHVQQIIKLCFSKTNFAEHYLTLDSAIIFTKNFDYLDLYSDDGVFFTAAAPRNKLEFYGHLLEVGERGWLNGQLVNLSQSLEAICGVMGNDTEDTHWYIAGNGFFASELCKELEDYSKTKGLHGFFGLIDFAPYEFAWYGEYVYMKRRNKFRPKYPLIFQPCIELTSLSDLELGALEVPEGFYGFLFQPPASEHIDFVVKALENRSLL